MILADFKTVEFHLQEILFAIVFQRFWKETHASIFENVTVHMKMVLKKSHFHSSGIFKDLEQDNSEYIKRAIQL